LRAGQLTRFDPRLREARLQAHKLTLNVKD